MCLDCTFFRVAWWRQFTGPVGRHLREEICWQFVEDRNNFEKACRQNIKAARGGFQMLYNVLQVFMVDRLELCHTTQIDFKWTQGQRISCTWYGGIDCLSNILKGGYDREGLNKYFTGVFSDIPFCDYLCLNICVHGDSTLKENTGMIRESNISHRKPWKCSDPRR